MDLTVGSKLIALNDKKFALLASVYELYVVAFIEDEGGGNLEGWWEMSNSIRVGGRHLELNNKINGLEESWDSLLMYACLGITCYICMPTGFVHNCLVKLFMDEG